MANFSDTLRVILKNEGGYNCAFTGSGETYKGIDRNYSSNWQGWKIVDQAKRTGKLDDKCFKAGEQFIKSPQLDKEVSKWYSSNLLKYFANFNAIQNQTLANFIADFMWHKPFRAIPIVNSIARFFNQNVITRNDALSNDVVRTINAHPSEVYTMLRNLRLAYYNNPKSINSSWDERFIKTLQGLINRVNSFPSSIPKNNFSWLFN